MRPFRLPILGLFLSGASLLAVACASAGGPPAAAPGASAVAPAAAPAGEPQRGGTFRMAIYGSFESLDPHHQAGGGKGLNNLIIYNGLLKFANEPVFAAERVQCDLCEKWEQTDPKTYVFSLRKGVKWHDVPPVSGREFVAEDVKFNLERQAIANPRFRSGALVAAIDKIDVPDAYTVRVALKAPSAPFLHNMATSWNAFVAKEATEAEEDPLAIKKYNIGTGPFIFKDYQPNVVLKTVRNPAFFQAGKPYLDAVDMYTIPDDKTRFAAFMAGEVDEPGFFVRPSDAEQMRKNPNLEVKQVFMTFSFAFAMNQKKKPFDDVRVRKAVNLALDRQEMVKVLAEGVGCINPPAISCALKPWAIPDEDLMKLPGYRQPKTEDIAEARRLVKEAGYEGLKLTLQAYGSGDGPDRAQLTAEQLRRNLGWDVSIEVLDPGVLTSRQLAGDWAGGHVPALAGTAEPDLALSLIQPSVKSAQARYGMEDPRLEEMIVKQRETPAGQERLKILRDLQSYLLEQNYVIGTYEIAAYRGWNKKFHGLSGEPRYGELIRWFSDAWMEK